jgi:hypothetical protein
VRGPGDARRRLGMDPGAILRYGADVGTRNILALLLVGACQAPSVGHTGFGSMPDVTTAPAVSTGGSSSGSSSSGTTTGEDSGSGGGAADSEPPRDLGVIPDFDPGTPVGCKGKIDFLFVISRDANMQYRQEQLAVAVPQFIETIQAKFEDFDYHIMVITGDDGWGNETCTELCPTLACKVGQPCCSWYHPDWAGKPCCDHPEYPCNDLDLVTQCDRTWGAGEVFPAGVDGEANKPCPIDGGRRYLVKGQTNLPETFACIAKVGASGNTLLGQALTAAMQSNINDPGGCNPGFLRKDALLMVTFIATNMDGPTGHPQTSKGTPAEWAQAVIDAKHGDDKSVVMFNILNALPECLPSDRICQLTEMFPYHRHQDVLAADYGPAFVEAAGLVETACAGFAPPG